jgi:hypothetical protein
MLVEHAHRTLEDQKANAGTAINFTDAKKRVIHSYRDWLRSVRIAILFRAWDGEFWGHSVWKIRGRVGGKPRRRGVAEQRATLQGTATKTLTITVQAPEIQTMYSLNMPVSTLRTKMRQEFERHRYVNQLKTVDVLLFNSHQEFQVRLQPEQ